MTIQEAETLYEYEVKKHEEEHNAYKEKMKEEIEKQSDIYICIGMILIAVGVILLLIGVTAPPEVSSTGYKSTPFYAIMFILFGIILGIIGGTFSLLTITKSKKSKKIENEPISYYVQNKHLYLNYIKCTDMNDTDKEYYKQKLEDMRNAELVSAVESASKAAEAAKNAANSAAAMSAISALYTTIKK